MLIEKDRQIEILKNMIEDLENISDGFIDVDDDILNNLDENNSKSIYDESSKIIGAYKFWKGDSLDIIYSTECARFFTKSYRPKK